MRKGDLKTLAQPLFFLENYLKGAAYRSGGANRFAEGTPPGALVALFLLDNRDHITNQH